MKPVSLLDDLKTLLGRGALANVARTQIEQAYLAQWPAPEALVEIGDLAGLGLYHTLALVLKADSEVFAHNRMNREARQREFNSLTASSLDVDSVTPAEAWAPWEFLSRFQVLLMGFDDCPNAVRFEVLVREQCVLGCHQIGARELGHLCTRFEYNNKLLDAASPSACEAFLRRKLGWLEQEADLAGLIDIQRRTIETSEQARREYLRAMADVYESYVSSARRLARFRYRLRLGDPTLTDVEVQELVALDLAGTLDRVPLVALEPDLQMALRDDVDGVRSDLRSMRFITELAARGLLTPASREDLQYAAILFYRLARKIHPDALGPAQLETLSPENRRRIDDIWNKAFPAHRNRAYLSKERLLDHVDNLERWHRQVDQILRNADARDPFRLIEGNTLDEQAAHIDCLLDDVLRQQRALRDDIAQRQFDPLFLEFQRLNRMSEQEREAERCRMARATQTWNTAADAIERELREQEALQARVNAQALKGARP